LLPLCIKIIYVQTAALVGIWCYYFYPIFVNNHYYYFGLCFTKKYCNANALKGQRRNKTLTSGINPKRATTRQRINTATHRRTPREKTPTNPTLEGKTANWN
jgi:hypothetical protein